MSDDGGDIRGYVRWWDAEQGFGVVDCPHTPGGCWTHFSVVAATGYRELEPSTFVRLEFERADQDGFAYRATRVWPEGSDPVAPADDGVSAAYSSRLTIACDEDSSGPARPGEGPGPLAVWTRSEDTLARLGAAAARAGMAVRTLPDDPAHAVDLPATAVLRAPTGWVAAALRAGVPVAPSGPTPGWFTGLPTRVTGRAWSLLDASGARAASVRGPVFVKLADGKHRRFPARRFPDADALDGALAGLGAGPDLQLLVTPDWLDVEAEYRAFCVGTGVVACQPYLVADEMWSPELARSPRSHADRAADWLGGHLAALGPGGVPPAAALDVAELADGRFALLEANQAWAAGLYSCPGDRVLEALVAASRPDPTGRWTFRPDPALPPG